MELSECMREGGGPSTSVLTREARYVVQQCDTFTFLHPPGPRLDIDGNIAGLG